MQAKIFHIVPTVFHSPSKLPSYLHQPSLPRKLPRAISISSPVNDNHHVPGPLTIPDKDESMAAFWDYQFLFISQRSETSEPITLPVVEGTIPPDFPSGTYYLTGPGLFVDDHGSTVHPLDGHGYLRAFSIDGVPKEVKFTAKYIKTEAQVEEHDPVTGSWRFTHRGPFSVLKGGKKLGNVKVMKNVANTSVLKWGGKLLCLWEGGDPYQIESETLDTVGSFNVINESLPSAEKRGPGDLFDVAARLLKPVLHGVFKMPPKRLLSHYKLVAQRNRLLAVTCNAEDMLLPRSNFTFYELDSNFNLLQKQEFNIPDHLMIHDWAFTDTYYILFGNRIKLDIIGSMTAVCGLSPMISALSVNPSKSTSPIYLLPRFPSEKSAGQRDWRVPVEAPSRKWLLHVGNAFEIKDIDGNSMIQIQACACSYQWFNFQKLFGYNWQSGQLDPSIMNVKQHENESLVPHLVHVTIKLDTNGSCHECSMENMNEWNKPSDFPIINPEFSGKKNTCIYAATSSGTRQALPHFPFDMVMKLNLSSKTVSTWSAGARRFIGEPIFVPKGTEEEDGYILVVEYAVSIQRCYLVILDPKRIGESDRVVARFEVPKHLNFPLGFHGFWAKND
ncbi:hypothetical protein ES288_D12G115800v1 [Gossypium darwinii]|uniref:Carotenoid cleavage dioxygenase 7 n=1 Tax=Gossypium darwinii TaxID=34276 RepID=A0A5D2A8J9_GOSDA|nr:hypothetical protein ES288_D12G115800v1 [Gossypium darwinii]